MNAGLDAEDELLTVLDAALRRSLQSPQLPAQFYLQLQSAIARGVSEPHLDRWSLQAEYQRELKHFRQGYFRLGWSMFAALLGAAFITWATVMLMAPLLRLYLPEYAPLAAPIIAAGFMLGVLAHTWRRYLSASFVGLNPPFF